MPIPGPDSVLSGSRKTLSEKDSKKWSTRMAFLVITFHNPLVFTAHARTAHRTRMRTRGYRINGGVPRPSLFDTFPGLPWNAVL